MKKKIKAIIFTVLFALLICHIIVATYKYFFDVIDIGTEYYPYIEDEFNVSLHHDSIKKVSAYSAGRDEYGTLIEIESTNYMATLSYISNISEDVIQNYLWSYPKENIQNPYGKNVDSPPLFMHFPVIYIYYEKESYYLLLKKEKVKDTANFFEMLNN
ncbi:hypothetical protein FACS189499_05190 [Clostridia bacterium]|nr:hypothetical protein FACS189499_05190 [Clostridia bacterium]